MTYLLHFYFFNYFPMQFYLYFKGVDWVIDTRMIQHYKAAWAVMLFLTKEFNKSKWYELGTWTLLHYYTFHLTCFRNISAVDDKQHHSSIYREWNLRFE